MKADYALTVDGYEELAAKAESFTGNAEKAINNALHNQAGDVIASKITDLIHPSGRRFKGHKSSAKNSTWQTYQKGNLAITVRSKTKYNYLYFPDDGSNTTNHVGGQDFTGRGTERAVPQIEQLLLTALDESWN